MINESQISLLHGCYCKLTGLNLPLKSICDSRRLAWERFAATGHTLIELETVVPWLKREIREGRNFPGCLRFTNLIEDLNRFEEYVAMAMAFKRNARPAPSAKEAFIRERIPITGPLVEKCTAVPIGRVIEAMRAEVDKRPA